VLDGGGKAQGGMRFAFPPYGPDLLIFKQAIVDYDIDSWFFLEEMWLVDGVLDLEYFSGYNLRNKYG
jgi:hypothetical protein